jgi:hypothetical protein
MISGWLQGTSFLAELLGVRLKANQRVEKIYERTAESQNA